MADVDRDRDDREGNDAKISLQLAHFEHFAEFSPENEEIGIEVDAEHDDEHRDDALQQAGVARAAVVAHAESAGTGTAEGDAERVKQRHACDLQDDDLRHGDTEVDGIQYFGSVFHARNELADSRARALCAHQVHVVAAGHGENSENEDDDAHSADPVRKAAPEQAGMAEGLDVRQDTGSGRRESGHRLKKRIGEVGNVARDHQRNRAQDTYDDPAEPDDNKTFPRIVSVTAELDRGDDPSDDKICHRQDSIYDRLLLPVEQAADSRKCQESTGELDHNAEYSPDNGIVHSRLLSVTEEYP